MKKTSLRILINYDPYMARGSSNADDILYGDLEARSQKDRPAPSAPDSGGPLVMLAAEAEENAWRVGWIGSKYSIYMRGKTGRATIWVEHDHALTEADLRPGALLNDGETRKTMSWQEIPSDLRHGIFDAEERFLEDGRQLIHSNTIPVINRPGNSRIGH